MRAIKFNECQCQYMVAKERKLSCWPKPQPKSKAELKPIPNIMAVAKKDWYWYWYWYWYSLLVYHIRMDHTRCHQGKCRCKQFFFLVDGSYYRCIQFQNQWSWLLWFDLNQKLYIDINCPQVKVKSIWDLVNLGSHK